MAEIEKIENLDQLESWLMMQDVRMSRTIAARAALRALPALMAVTDQFFNKTPGTILLLAGLRASLISGVAGNCPTPDMKNLRDAADSAAAFSAAFSAARSSAAFLDATVGQDLGRAAVFGHPLWPEGKAVAPLLAHWDTFEAREDPEGIWRFWREWYRGMLQGTPMDWDLQLQVALIDNAIWEAGPEAIAKEIARIRQAIEANGHEENKQSSEQPVSAATAEAMAQLLQTNRDAISLTTASLLEQIAEFREKMRGNNQVDSEFREQILAFLDQLSEKLRNLVEALPAIAETTDTKAGEKAVLWLRDFKAHFFKEAAAYASPENIAKSAIPTGIILGCTAVGSLVGMPVAGTVVGGLITGQLKPGKAADDLLKPKSTGAD